MILKSYFRLQRTTGFYARSKLTKSSRRFLSSHNSSKNHSPDQLIQNHLSTLGYSNPSINQEMIHVLKSVFGNTLTISQVNSLGKEGTDHL